VNLASDCPICSRALGESGHLVVDRAYWHHECAKPPTLIEPPTDNEQTATSGVAPRAAQSLLEARLRVLVSPMRDSNTIEQFSAALQTADCVRRIDLEQFVGQTVVLAIDSPSVAELIAALLNLPGFPLAGLTISADGQLSVRLDELAVSRSAPLIGARLADTTPLHHEEGQASVQAQAARAAVSSDAAAMEGLTSTVNRLKSQLNRVLNEMNAPAARTALAATTAEAPQQIVRPDRVPGAATPEGSVMDQQRVPVPEPASSFFRSTGPLDEQNASAAWHETAAAADAPAGQVTGQDRPRRSFPMYVDEPVATGWRQSPASSPVEATVQAEPPAGAGPSSALTVVSLEAVEVEPFEENSRFEHGEAYVPQRRASSPGEVLSESNESMPRRRSDTTPEKLQVVAYPFENFAGVNSFINAIRLLPDVRHVAPRRFRGGTIQLSVDYSGSEQLSEQIRGLDDFEPRIVSQEGDIINVAIGGSR